jgi:hypothetical protein
MKFGSCSTCSEVLQTDVKVGCACYQAWWGRNRHRAPAADRDKTRFPSNGQWWRFIPSGRLCGRRGGAQLDVSPLPCLPNSRERERVQWNGWMGDRTKHAHRLQPYPGENLVCSRNVINVEAKRECHLLTYMQNVFFNYSWKLFLIRVTPLQVPQACLCCF